MVQMFHVTSISRIVPHSANQVIQPLGELPPLQRRGRNTIYDSRSAYPTAFRIVRDKEVPTRVCVPLTVAGRLASSIPQGKYYMKGTTAEDSFRLISHPFNLIRDEKGDEKGNEKGDGEDRKIRVLETPDVPDNSLTPNPQESMFYCEGLNVHCPFKLTGPWIWRLYRFDDYSEVARSDPTTLEIYFFLGPTALPPPWGGSHVLELIRLTVPDYRVVKGKSRSQTESQVVTDISRSLWNHGGIGLQYDIESGQSSYLTSSVFLLGAILRRRYNRCNCYDLAAFVYTAFKSLGCRVDGSDVSEYLATWEAIFLINPQIFDIKVLEKVNWGYIRTGTLYGWASGGLSQFCNNPFPIYPSRTPLRPATEIWSIDPMHQSRRPFSRHCFTVFRSGNLASEKVIDICHVLRDPTRQLDFRDGCPSLQTYLHSRDVGLQPFGDGDLRGTCFCLVVWRSSLPKGIGLPNMASLDSLFTSRYNDFGLDLISDLSAKPGFNDQGRDQ